MPIIDTKNLSKEFQVPIKNPGLSGAIKSFFNKQYKIVQAVKNVSFQIEKGELVGFLGPNGAGKTTTLKLLSGLLYPTSGTIEILGHTPWKRETPFQKKFSMVMGQRTQLWWDLPARETYALNQKIYEIPEKEFQEMQSELIAFLELEEIVNIPVKKLSLGERMKAELACALLHKPEVLLLDEPTLGLDVVMQKKLRSFIRDYNQRYRATILLTSHYMNDVEELCKRVMIIHGGQLLYDGDLEKIVKRFAPNKLISFSSTQPLQMDFLKKLGEVVSVNDSSAKIEVPRQEISQVVGRLLKQASIVDLNIEELAVEEIIRRVFMKTSAEISSFSDQHLLTTNSEENVDASTINDRPLP